MIVDCISDCHGHYPKLEGGDLLIVAGDLTGGDTEQEYLEFSKWLGTICYRKVIVIGGNHDNYLIDCAKCFVRPLFHHPTYVEYLCDSGTEFEGLKIWGSPWTLRFEGMNPQAMAFTCETEEELAEKWALIPDDVDILVTHSPPRSVLDWNNAGDNFGSTSLLMRTTSLSNLKLFVFGHIHEAYGLYNPKDLIEFEQKNKHIFGPAKCKSMPYIVNASHVNERYEPVNKPIRIEL